MLVTLGLFLPAGSLLKRTLDVERGLLCRLDEKPFWSVPWSVHPFVASSVTFISRSLMARLSFQAKAFPATLASVTRARAPCPIQILG